MSKFTVVPESLQESKAYKILEKIFGENDALDFYRRDTENLEATIVACETQQSQAKAEMEANEAYKKANAIVKDFRKSLAEVFKPLKAKKESAAEILNYQKDLANIPTTPLEEDTFDVEVSIDG